MAILLIIVFTSCRSDSKTNDDMHSHDGADDSSYANTDNAFAIEHPAHTPDDYEDYPITIDENLSDEDIAYVRRTVRSLRNPINIISQLSFIPLTSITDIPRDLRTGSMHISEVEGIIRVNGEFFLTTIGNLTLPDVTNLQSLGHAVRSVHTQDKTLALMAQLIYPPRPITPLYEDSWRPDNPIFIEVNDVLYSKLQDNMGGGPHKAWAEGLILVEQVTHDNGHITDFTVVVNGWAYYDAYSPFSNAQKRRLKFIIENGNAKLHSNELFLTHIPEFDFFITFRFPDDIFTIEEGFIYFGSESCESSLTFIDGLVHRAISTNQIVYYFDLDLFKHNPFAEEVFSAFNVTSTPLLIHTTHGEFNIVFNDIYNRMDEFFS